MGCDTPPPRNTTRRRFVATEGASSLDPPVDRIRHARGSDRNRDDLRNRIDSESHMNRLSIVCLIAISMFAGCSAFQSPNSSLGTPGANAVAQGDWRVEARGRFINGGRVEIQVDLQQWDELALDHRNLLFWHEVGRVQNDAIPRDGWEMAALAIGLGGAIGELWVQDGLLLMLAMGLSGFAGYRLYLKNNSEKRLQDAIAADERAIALATRFGYTLPNAYKSLGGALKERIEKTRKKRQRGFFEDRLEALRKSAGRARAEMAQQQGSSRSVTSENVYG